MSPNRYSTSHTHLRGRGKASHQRSSHSSRVPHVARAGMSQAKRPATEHARQTPAASASSRDGLRRGITYLRRRAGQLLARYRPAARTARPQGRGGSAGFRLSFAQRIGLAIAAATVGLAMIFLANARMPSAGDGGLAGQYRFDVAQPGPGQVAPIFNLPATDGTTVDLGTYRGKTVLLYFHEGIGCEPCWDQLKDIEHNQGDFQQLGIDAVLSITTNPLEALKQKVVDEGLHTPVLADERFAVSLAYHANEYGMMGKSADGHTFILVGPDGRIRWRADYGGPPEYTMYVPVPNLVADIQEGIRASQS